MLELLDHLFAAVCGQNPDHTWAPGGIPLPCCQRCTGLYVGACAAAMLHYWLRPKLTGRFLEMHGVFLLAMAPFGFHWVPQGPVVRTITGMLFGFAVVTFLWLPVSRLAGRTRRGARLRLTRDERVRADASARRSYFSGVVLTAIVLVGLTTSGGRLAAYSLSFLLFLGAAALGTLVAANLGLGLAGLFQRCRRVWSRRLGHGPT
jgi:uncharacterized membrane protein